MLLGVAFCGWAGYQREKTQPLPPGAVRSGKTYMLVMILCVVSGFLAALLNIALAFGGDIVNTREGSRQRRHSGRFSQCGRLRCWAD